MSLLSSTTRNAETMKTSKGSSIAESAKIGMLEYNMIRPSSLVTQRRSIEHSAQSNTYNPSSSIVTFVNSGDDYINGRTSFLRFDVAWTTTAGDYGAYGSAVNLFDSITIHHSSGTQIERLETLNLEHMVQQVSTKTAGYLVNNATAWGHGNQSATITVTNKYAIPLSHLSKFWDTDMLIPNMLHSGLKVVIGLASNTGTTGGTFIVSSPTFHMDSVTLTDNAQIWLQERSAKQGLVFPFTSYEHVSTNGGGSVSSYSINVMKAVSQATFAVAVARTTASVAVDTADSFLPIALAADETQTMAVHWKLAGQQFPQSTITSLSTNYMWSRNQWGNVEAESQIQGPVDASSNDLEYSGIFPLSLERDHLIAGQGHPLSGSRALNFSCTFGQGAVARTVDVFVYYTKLARVYLFDKVLVQS